MNATPDILVVVEDGNGALPPNLMTLAAAARCISSALGGIIGAVVAGPHAGTRAKQTAEATGWPATGIVVETKMPLSGGQIAAVLAQNLEPGPPKWILTGHSAAAQEWAPCLSCRLEGVCVSGVQEVIADRGALRLNRPVYGGKLLSAVVPERFPAVLVMLPGGDAQLPAVATPGPVRVVGTDCPPVAGIVTGTTRANQTGVSLSESKTIVAVGTGLASEDGLEMAKALARCFPGGAVAGSRPVVDAGLLPRGLQVGLTGVTVRPDLYIACGISGAFQHVAGIRDAGFIVAINRDPQATIFQVADVGIVADLAAFLPEFIAVLEAYREETTKGTHL